MDEAPKDEKMHFPSFSKIVESTRENAVVLALSAGIGLTGFLGRGYFDRITTQLDQHGAIITAIQKSVSDGQATNIGTHYELKMFRAETAAAREQTAQRLELIERQIKEIEPRVKEIEQRVKVP